MARRTWSACTTETSASCKILTAPREGCSNQGRAQVYSADLHRAWRAFNAAHATVTAKLRAELARVTDLTIGEVEVLDWLVECGNRARMAELADLVHASRSGLTRRVDRLQNKGLVVRARAEDDGRGAYAVLTRQGAKVAAQVSVVYHRAVSEHFVVPLEPHTSLVDALEELAAG